MATNTIWKTLTKISLAVVLMVIWGFMWVRSDILFPVNTQLWRLNYILTYIVLVAFIFSWDTLKGSKTEKALFRASFLKKFPKFLLFAFITLVILFIAGQFLPSGSLRLVSEGLSGIGLGVILLHAFMVSIGEELIFRGWIPERLKEAGIKATAGILISTIIFALFHAGMGKSFITLLTYIPLGLMFHAVKRRWSPLTNMANAGAHFGWNVFILGFLVI